MRTSADLELSRSGDGARLTVRGEIDVATAQQFGAAVDETIDEAVGDVQLDLADVSFADSVGLAALIRCRRRAARLDKELVLLVGDGAVGRLLETHRPHPCLRRPADSTQGLGRQEQYTRALQAFETNGYFVLIGERQAESLDDKFKITPDTEISFVKLLPLVGG